MNLSQNSWLPKLIPYPAWGKRVLAVFNRFRREKKLPKEQANIRLVAGCQVLYLIFPYYFGKEGKQKSRAKTRLFGLYQVGKQLGKDTARLHGGCALGSIRSVVAT